MEEERLKKKAAEKKGLAGGKDKKRATFSKDSKTG